MLKLPAPAHTIWQAEIATAHHVFYFYIIYYFLYIIAYSDILPNLLLKPL